MSNDLKQALIAFLQKRKFSYVELLNAESVRKIYQLFFQDIIPDNLSALEMTYCGKYFMMKNDTENMFKYMNSAIELGEISAMNCKGFYCFKQGDEEKMLQYYQMAADLGNLEAIKKIINYKLEKLSLCSDVAFIFERKMYPKGA